MFLIATIFLLLLAVGRLLASPLQNRQITQAEPIFSGFQEATTSLSVGGKAFCISGNVPVSAAAHNENLLIQSPTNQSVVTNLFIKYVQVNSTLATLVNGGDSVVSDTYNINVKLCYPLDWDASTHSKSIHFLIHGIGFDKNYWDFAEGYSYVDAAAAAGYPTFSYDRLGVGASDHPDPIQVVQASLQLEIAHSLAQSLRHGAISDQSFSHVIGVGHSLGSIQSLGITAKYPNDFDAVILTGFSTNTASVPLTFVGFNPAIASKNQPLRFGDLPTGYLVSDTAISNQLIFLRAPNFDPKIFVEDNAAKQTFTLGELFTLGSIVEPAVSFTGPVSVVNGEFDFVFCQSDCNQPTDQSALVLERLYPAAGNGSQSSIVPGMGHAINVHYQAPQVFQQMLDFVTDNGF